MTELRGPRNECIRAAALALGLFSVTGCASSGAVPHPFPAPRGTEPPPAIRQPLPPGDPRSEAALPEDPPPGDPAGQPPPDGRPGGDRMPAEAILETALALVGTPYRDGGSSPDGFDCSGFTQWVFARHGLLLPRATRQQFGEGVAVRDVAPGDLLFFSTVAAGASHVAIAIDADRFVHAPSSKGVVRVERRSSAYWGRRFVGARRIAE